MNNRNKGQRAGPAGRQTARTAIFWDNSFLWGLIAFRTFSSLRVNFDLLTAGDIQDGLLEGYDILVVPGGWASDKIVSLGAEGAAEIRSFVENGGSYLGFCGGAGLALEHESGLGLLPVNRMPTRERLPSFSGNIELGQEEPGHPVWKGIDVNSTFHAWWPGQFALGESTPVTVIATYGNPGFDAFVTDLPVVEGMDWRRWEECYGINLDPSRIMSEPAVIETSLGAGKVLLSYIHFETPGDTEGQRALLNLLAYLSGGGLATGASGFRSKEIIDRSHTDIIPDAHALSLAGTLEEAARSLFRFGHDNLLWYRRRDWLLQWRRGIRGIEYSTLDAMLTEISQFGELAGGFDAESNHCLEALAERVLDFYADASRLLMLERLAMTRGPLSPLKCDDEEIQAIRERLFSANKRCGGLYRQIVEMADGILLRLLRRRLVGG
jgi:putative intracellular protease/amidase